MSNKQNLNDVLSQISREKTAGGQYLTEEIVQVEKDITNKMLTVAEATAYVEMLLAKFPQLRL